MACRDGELWRFTVTCGAAERVYLVKECIDGISNWVQMDRSSNGQWQIEQHLGPGKYRLRYYTTSQGTFINCGTTGLRAEHLSGLDRAVRLEAQLALAQPA